MSVICWINGDFVPLEDASIGVSDFALQRGYAVFDFARTYNGHLFRFGDHLARLRQSADALYLPISVSDAELTGIACRVIQESSLERPAVRIFVTGGDCNDALFENSNIIVTGEERAAVDPVLYETGVSLLTHEFQRELPAVKSINYLNAVRLEPLKREHNVFDVLYFSAAGVTECPRNNFFVVRDGVLITPAENVLPGITRSVVLQLATGSMPVEERMLHREELPDVDEAFITSTSKRIVPVSQIDRQPVGTGRPGPVTQSLMRLFDEYVHEWKG